MSKYRFQDDHEVNQICDRMELRMWARGARFSVETIQQELQDGLDGDVDAYEDAVAVLECVENRSSLLGELYPFRAEKGVAFLSDSFSGCSTYLACVALSELDSNHIPEKLRHYFEYLALDAAKRFFNPKHFFLTGSESHQIQFKSYEELVTSLGVAISELRSPVKLAPRGRGDNGWDFILVCAFNDACYPRLLVGGNCATGRTNFMQKGSETAFEHWFRYFFDGRTPIGPVLEVFAVPFILNEDDRSRKTGPRTIVMDRLRLAELGECDLPAVNELLENLRVPADDLVLR